MQALKTITFVYVPQEDRIAAVINAGHIDSRSYWLTRRITLALLKQVPNYLAGASDIVQRAPAGLRRDVVAFEREAAIAQTSSAMSQTSSEALRSSASNAELIERLTISPEKNGFRFELYGHDRDGSMAILTRAELQRIVQMLQEAVAKAGWTITTTEPAAVQPAEVTGSKSAQH